MNETNTILNLINYINIKSNSKYSVYEISLLITLMDLIYIKRLDKSITGIFYCENVLNNDSLLQTISEIIEEHNEYFTYDYKNSLISLENVDYDEFSKTELFTIDRVLEIFENIIFISNHFKIVIDNNHLLTFSENYKTKNKIKDLLK